MADLVSSTHLQPQLSLFFVTDLVLTPLKMEENLAFLQCYKLYKQKFLGKNMEVTTFNSTIKYKLKLFY